MRGVELSRKLRLCAAGVLALTLFLAGALLGPLRPKLSEGSPTQFGSSQDAPLSLAASSGSLDANISTLQTRVRAEPEDWASLASLGLAYTQKARVSADPSYYPKAESVLQRSLALEDTENHQAMLGMGALALARHDFAEGLHWGLRAKKVNPYNAQARGIIGDAYTELGRYDEAAEAFQAMVDLRPDLSSYARVGYARELHGDVGGAIRAMSMALSTAQGDPSDAAWVGYQLGELYFNSGRYAAALREYRNSRFLDRTSVLPDVGIARVAAARGDLDQAQRLLERVTTRLPSSEYVILLGDLYMVDGKRRRARRQYELVGAIERLYRSNGVNVDLEQALFDADHGRDLEAALTRMRAEYRRRQSVHVADALAWTLYRLGDHAQAYRYSKESLRLGTKSALLNFHAGMIALELGRSREARTYLTRALDINPYFSFLHHETATRTLDRLGGPRR